MRLLGLALIQTHVTVRTRNSDTQRNQKHAHTQKSPGEDIARRHCLQAKERDLKGNQPCQHLDLGLAASATERKQNSVL